MQTESVIATRQKDTENAAIIRFTCDVIFKLSVIQSSADIIQ